MARIARIASQSSSGASECPSQPVPLVSRSRRLPAGAMLEIRDSSGAVLLSHRAADSFPMSAFTSPALAIGETYAPRIDGARADNSIRLGGVVTNARG